MTPSTTPIVPPVPERGAAAGDWPSYVPMPPGPPLWGLDPEDVPDIENLVIDDGQGVDSIFSEKQMRLLTEPLYSSWPGPAPGVPFVAMANVGVFHTTGKPPIAPDTLLAVGIQQGQDLSRKENLSYFVWLRGKVPDVTFEIVSNREGAEDTEKLATYAQIGVAYYVIYDPQDLLGKGRLRVYQRRGGTYRLMEPPWWFEEVGLGVTLWEGRYEDETTTWVRWCDRAGNLIPTGAERAELERREKEEAAQLAEQERQRAEQEHQRAEQASQELERLKAHLRQLGIEPPG